MISKDRITETFYLIDEFCIEFENVTHEPTLTTDTTIKKRNQKSILSDSEVMTIMVMFHRSNSGT